VAGIFGFDLYRSVTEAKTNTDTVGHVAGLTSGMLYFLLWRMRGGRGGAF
jgi:rhomboid-like protein